MRVMRLLVSTVLLVLATASAATAQARMWVIRDADSTIYLLGTFHVLLPAGVADY
jgi:uncharacterized protein YbaP (TraB family)